VTVNEKVKQFHKIRRGETVATIAKKYHCTTAQLRSWNKSKLSRSSKLIAGQSLAVYINEPKSIYIENPLNGTESDDDKLLLTDAEKKNIDKVEKEEDDNAPVIEKTAVKSTPAKYLYHTVAPGDTLFNIAKKYDGLTVEQLKSLNKISDDRSLKPGTKLKVKVKS
jgi:LysM repeat protein